MGEVRYRYRCTAAYVGVVQRNVEYSHTIIHAQRFVLALASIVIAHSNLSYSAPKRWSCSFLMGFAR